MKRRWRGEGRGQRRQQEEDKDREMSLGHLHLQDLLPEPDVLPTLVGDADMLRVNKNASARSIMAALTASCWCMLRLLCPLETAGFLR